MTELGCSDDATRLLRVIQDAVWSLEQNYPTGALAILRGAMEQEQRRQSGVRVDYLYRGTQ